MNIIRNMLAQSLAGALLVAFSSCSINEGKNTGIIDETENLVVGQVLDAQGKPLPGARVSLYGESFTVDTNVTTFAKRVSALPQSELLTVTTDQNGHYQFKGTYKGKAYLKLDYKDSLGLLDSLDFDVKDSFDLDKQLLKQNGVITIATDNLEVGTIVWVPALNEKFTITVQGTPLTIQAPPCMVVVIILVAGEEVGNTNPVDVEPGQDTDVDASKLVMTDTRDGQEYSIVKIGTQVWMAENLNYGTLVTTPSEIQIAGEKYCQSDLESNCDILGGLYQWQAAMNFADTCSDQDCSSLIETNHQGICPDGWHIPDQEDYDLLVQTLGGVSVAGSKMKSDTTGLASWDAALYNDGNSSGFTATPSGSRYFDGTFAYSFPHARHNSTWWQANDDASTGNINAWLMGVSDEDSNFKSLNVYRKIDAMSVRCVKN